MAGPKQYADLCGTSVVGHTLAALDGVVRLDRVMVVLSPDDTQFESRVPRFAGVVARCGGDTRADTVANGLVELERLGAQAHDWVLVHDAARCLVRPVWIDALIDACADDPVGGLLALPVADTLKDERDGRVVHQHPVVGPRAARRQLGQARAHGGRARVAAAARDPAREVRHVLLELAVARAQHHQRVRQARHAGQRGQRVRDDAGAGHSAVLLRSRRARPAARAGTRHKGMKAWGNFGRHGGAERRRIL